MTPMLKILFFARLREELGVTTLELELGPQGASVADIIARLIAERGASWSQILSADNLVLAVNQSVAAPTAWLQNGDELAIFPPVTGG